jgi:hypothetical protein
MSENEDVVQSMLESANRHDAAAIHAYLGEAMHAINPSVGASAASRMHAVQSALMAGFPNLRYRMDRLLRSGDMVVVECTCPGRTTVRSQAYPRRTKRSKSQPLSASKLWVGS